MNLQANGFDWDKGNRAKCEKHGLSTSVIENLFTRPLAILPDAAHSQGERRFRAIGRTDRGAACSSCSRFGAKGMNCSSGLLAPVTCTRRRSMRMKKKIPTFKNDRGAASFVNKADLTQYDLSGATLTRFEIKPKDKSINLRLSGELYDAVRKRAARAGVPYQRFIRLTLEQAIAGPK
jgi:predicted DNA binding CopG/RHH family protein/uncharacterized DUF497 family protein